MLNKYQLLFTFLLSISSIQAFSQPEIDSLKKISPLHSPNQLQQNLLNAPEQIGFGKLTIDSVAVKVTNKIKQRILDSAYRSVTLFMALHEKEFRAWERLNFKKPPIINLNLNLGKLPIPMMSGISLAWIFGKRNRQMSAEDRWELELRWREEQRKQREQRSLGKYQDNDKQDQTFTVPLQTIINDFLNTHDGIHF